MKKVMQYRVYQAVAKVVFLSGRYKWYRISRQKYDSLVFNFQRMPDFRYAKFYEIENYSRLTTKRGYKHKIGRQIGFITLNGWKFF